MKNRFEKVQILAKIAIFLPKINVARAWPRWPTENFSPSLMHTVNDYLSEVGSKKAVSFMVLEKNVPPIVSFFYHGHILLLLLLVVVAYTFLSIIGCRQCSPINS